MENEHEARSLIAIEASRKIKALEAIAAELGDINITLFQLLQIVIDNQDD